MRKIQKLGAEITLLDVELLKFLNKRGILSQQIGKEKIRLNNPILVPQRGTQILEQIKKLNTGPYTPQMIEDVYRLIFKIRRELQKDSI
ncbi:chorismate mutase [Bacillus thuringiensis]|nr:chorismate mutase [Bacillus thuringiensis]